VVLARDMTSSDEKIMMQFTIVIQNVI